MGPHRVLAAPQDLDAADLDAPVHLGRRREQSHQGEQRGRLAAAGLADQAQPLTGVHLEAHALDRVEPPAVRQVEPDVEVRDGEQAHGAGSSAVTGVRAGRIRHVWIDRCATRRRGFSASSIAWPIR